MKRIQGGMGLFWWAFLPSFFLIRKVLVDGCGEAREGGMWALTRAWARRLP